VDLVVGLVETLTGWWEGVCSVRAFNRLALYSPTDIAAHPLGAENVIGFTPEQYYAQAVGSSLSIHGREPIRQYLMSGGRPPYRGASLGRLLGDAARRGV
jgi:hypothetical protein